MSSAGGGSVAGFARRLRSLRGLLLLYLLLGSGIALTLRGKEIGNGAFLIGDCPYYASAAVSLWMDGDLDLRNQLKGGLAVHQRQVALGRNGEWFPKHPILMPVLSVPFYVALGTSGFLAFNVTVFLALAAVLYLLVRTFCPDEIAAAATLGILGGTFMRAYVYNYSPDLVSALLVLAGLGWALRGANLRGGLLLGLSVLAKVTNLFTAALLILFQCLRTPRSSAGRTLAGMVPGLLLAGAINVVLFGSPTTSGYDRTIVLDQGSPELVSHRGFFDLPWTEGAWGQLVDSRVGLIPTSPILLLTLPGWVILLRRRNWEGLLLLSVTEFTYLLFSTYRWWATSHYGNRFLMVPVCLGAVPLALTLEWATRTLAGEPRTPSLSPAIPRGR